jgi:hypothetical protein
VKRKGYQAVQCTVERGLDNEKERLYNEQIRQES